MQELLSKPEFNGKASLIGYGLAGVTLVASAVVMLPGLWPEWWRFAVVVGVGYAVMLAIALVHGRSTEGRKFRDRYDAWRDQELRAGRSPWSVDFEPMTDLLRELGWLRTGVVAFAVLCVLSQVVWSFWLDLRWLLP